MTKKLVLYSLVREDESEENVYHVGFHGYWYDTDMKPIRAASPPKYKITNGGYQDKVSIAKEDYYPVFPQEYIDAYCKVTDSDKKSSQYLALAKVMDKVLENDTYDEVLLIHFNVSLNKFITDIRAAMEANWIDKEGNPIPKPEPVLAVSQMLECMDSKNIEFTTDRYIVANEYVWSNKIMDTMAIYRRKAKQNKELFFFDVSDPKGYWNPTRFKPYLIDNRWLFFNTELSKDMGNVFFTADYKTGVKPGSKNNEVAYNVVVLKEPIAIVEQVKSMLSEATGGIGFNSTIRLDLMWKPYIQRALNDIGTLALDINHGTRGEVILNVLGDPELPIAKVIHPQGLSDDAIMYYGYLYSTLYQCLEDNLPKGYVVVDITNKVYNLDDKTLNPDIDKDAKWLKVKLTPKDGVPKNFTATLVFGKDIPSLNILKRVAKMNPILKLLVVADEPGRYQTHTCLITDESRSIWTSRWANSTLFGDRNAG